jgi:hypothetical protein
MGRPNKRDSTSSRSRAANITVTWADDCVVVSLPLIPRNWNRVKSGKPLSIRGKGYYYEAEFFWDYWHFSGGLDGELMVCYGQDGGTGFKGCVRDADIEEVEHAPKRRPQRGKKKHIDHA